MRTTVRLDDEVAAAVRRLRAERKLVLSEAVNELIKAGVAVPRARKRFVQRSFAMGARVDVANVADTIERLEGTRHR